MTEGQLRFQSLMENQRHNLVMERYEKEKTQAQTLQAESSARQASVAEQNVNINLMNAETNARNAATREREADIAGRKVGLDIGSFIISMLLPDANTVMRTGGQMMSSLFS